MSGRGKAQVAAFMWASLALVGGAGFVAFREIVPFFDLATSDGVQFDLLTRRAVQLPFAAPSQVALLERCLAVSSSVYARAQPTAKRKMLVESCRNYALEIVTQSPTLGVAWAIAASFSAELRTPANFVAEILESQRVAPSEQWIAEFRVAVVEDNGPLDNAELLNAEASDLQILVHSARGVKSIAQRYIDKPAFRERVKRVVERMTPADQRHFVDALEQAVAQRSGGG